MARKRQVHVIEIKSRRGKKWYPLLVRTNREEAQAIAKDQSRFYTTDEFRVVTYTPTEQDDGE